MKSPSDIAPLSEDRKVAAPGAVVVAEGVEAAADRRRTPRSKTTKDAKIILETGVSIECIVRDISASGAVLEVQSPVQQRTFEVAFDGDDWLRRSCRVVWVKEVRMGVEFLTMGALLDGYDSARQRRDEQVAEHHRKEEAIDHELHEVLTQMSQASKFLKEKEITYEIGNRTLRVAHKRAPIIAVHYHPEDHKYETTFMPDGSHATVKTPEECAKAIGEMIFAVVTRT